MKNREIYQKDPASRKLVNEGVANVNDEKTSQALGVLRYELETFVCDGQYEKGMAHILEMYLKAKPLMIFSCVGSPSNNNPSVGIRI